MYILIPDPLQASALKVLALAEAFTYYDPATKPDRATVLELAAKADGMIVRSGTTVDQELLDNAPQLKAIVRAGVGVDNIDLEAATARSIVVMNTPEANTVATAEMTLGLMLALARHIPAAHQALSERRWERKSWLGTELSGKTLGLVGFGRVGRAVAERARAFGMDIVAYDPYLPPDFRPPDYATLVDSLREVYTAADYLSLHAVVTDETHHMINTGALRMMKKGVRIINAARGALINAHALADALSKGQVAGAALDVYESEPPSDDHPLIGLENVVHTPHLGASTVEAQEAVGTEAAQTIVAALRDQDYRNVVNPAVLETS